MQLAAVTEMNSNALAFLAVHMASAKRLGLEDLDGVNAIRDLLSAAPGGATRALTRGDGRVETEQGFVPAPAPAAENSRGFERG